MKRTKRYGGFRIGDRVRVKGKQYKWLKEGVVKALTDGYCSVYFKENSELLSEPVHYCFMPNQLINLTRIEEQEQLKKMLNELEEISQRSVEISNKTLESMKEWHRLTFPPFPSPYTRDVYTTTKDF